MLYLEENFAMVLLILFLFCFRFETFFMPLYWDESIYFTVDTFDYGLLSFFPGYYNPEAYHGHPFLLQIFLLFSSYIFGANPFAAHMLSFLSFAYFLVIAHSFFKHYIQAKTSFLILLLFLTLPFVFVQSVMFIPNYLMIAFALHAYIMYLRQDYKCYFLLALCAVMTRESAIAFFLVPLLHTLYQHFKNHKNYKRILMALTPFIGLILFFIYNKYNSLHDKFINHPYVNTRISKNEINFEKIYQSIGTSLKVLKEATYLQLPFFIFIIFALAIVYLIYKKRLKIKISLPHILLLSSAMGFGIFFLLYGDSIARDFTFVTLIFCVYLMIPLGLVFRKEIIALLLIVTASFNFNAHFYEHGLDLSYSGFYTRIISYKNLANIINEKYADKYWIKCGWPCTRLFERQEFGYVSQNHRTTIFDWQAHMMFKSLLSPPEPFGFDPSVWEIEYTYQDDFNLSKSKFYKKIKELPSKEGIYE